MRRYRTALVFALLLAGGIATVNVVIPDICNSLTPGGWLWWLNGCDKDSSGGGGSGAGEM